MATLRLIIARQPPRLLEAAADAFLQPPRPGASPFPTPACLLALRQGGLRDDLIALAAAKGVRGWFDPPLCLFAQLPETLAGRQDGYCDDYERVVLLSAVLRSVAPAVLARPPRTDAFVDAVDRLFGEWIGEGEDEQLVATALAEQPLQDSFVRLRNAELVAAYGTYLERLKQANRFDSRARLIHTAERIAADPAGLAARLGGRREIRLLGLQDLRGGWTRLLAALRDSPALDTIGIYTSVRLDLDEQLPVDDIIELPEPASLAQVLFLPENTNVSVAPDRPRIELFSSPDAEREVESVAARIRRLIEQGARPERIAVVARSARPWVDLMLNALGRAGVDATARRRYAFAEIPVVRSVLALFAVARDGWTRHNLVELAQQPYLGVELDAFVLNHIGYRRRVEGLAAWKDATQSLLREAKAREKRAEADEEQDQRKGSTPPSDRVADALEDFIAFAERAAALEGERPLRDWLEWLRTTLLGPAWGIERRIFRITENRFDVVRVDAAGLRGVRQIVHSWDEAVQRWGGGDERLSVAAFEARLREMLAGDAALWTGTRRGVQLIEALAAAHRPFDHMFMIGLSGGTFPLGAPRSPLLDDEERAALTAAGLRMDTRERWDTRERALFRTLVSGPAQSLTLSWPRLDARGNDTTASAFVDEVAERTGLMPEVVPTDHVITRGIPLITDAACAGYAAHGARIERDRQTGRLSPWNGRIEDPEIAEYVRLRLSETDYIWSPTQLESYAKCPWSWFSERLLRLARFEDPDIDIDPRARGSILHDALRRFFDAAIARTGGPVFLLPAHYDEWARPLIHDSLDQAIESADSELWLGQPALRDTKRAELRRMLERYIEKEAELNHSFMTSSNYHRKRVLRTAVAEHELAFEQLLLDLGTTRIRLRGTVDRVETGIDERVAADNFVAAVDYKTSKYSSPGGGDGSAWDDGVVLQVPLYARALTQLRPGTRVSRVEYRAIRSGERVHSLDLVKVMPSGGRNQAVEDADEAEKMRGAIEAAGRHVERARTGEYPASPAPSCMCPSWCHAWEICRVKGGPQTKW